MCKNVKTYSPAVCGFTCMYKIRHILILSHIEQTMFFGNFNILRNILYLNSARLHWMH